MPAHAHTGVVRRLRPSDHAMLRDHFLRLDSASRRGRFGLAVGEEFLDGYADRTMRSAAVLFGFFDAGGLRAVGELHPVAPATAEAAFSVEPGWQGNGIGTGLMDRVLRAASGRGDRRVRVVCAASNRVMRRLAARHRFAITVVGGDAEGEVATRWPNAFAALRGALDTASRLALAGHDAAAARLRPPLAAPSGAGGGGQNIVGSTRSGGRWPSM